MKAKNDFPKSVVLLSSKPEPLCIPPYEALVVSPIE